MDSFFKKSYLIMLITALLVTFLISSTIFSQQLSLKQLTFSDSTHDGYPNWSPDGKFIIYSSGTRTACMTKRIPSEGGSAIQLTNYFSQHAQYSPDGSQIVFDGENGSKVYIASADGGEPIQIVPDSIPIERSGMPCWSPDGKKVAFHSKGVLWTVEVETGTLKKIFDLEGNLTIPFCWTNDGNNIIAELMDTASAGTDLWKIPINAKEASQLTFMEGRQKKPCLSPDGSLILFASDHGGNVDLWIMPSGGGDPVQLTSYAGDDSNPGYDLEASWSPDGKKIAFSSTRTGYWAIWLMEPDLEFIKGKLNKK